MSQVSLKLAKVQDAEIIYNLIDASREHLREWLPWVDISKSPVSTENYLIENSSSNFYEGRLIFEIFFWDEFCGMIDLHNGNAENKSVDIGYWVGENYQGRNIATEACKILINKAFTEYDVETIFIRCAEKNIKSRAIPIKLNFDLVDKNTEIIMREISHRLFVYALTKPKWYSLKVLFN